MPHWPRAFPAPPDAGDGRSIHTPLTETPCDRNDSPGVNWTSDGTMPMTVIGRPLSVMSRPTSDGSAANRRRQKPSLSTTTPGSVVSSAGRNVRPRIGLTPRTSKNEAVTDLTGNDLRRAVGAGQRWPAACARDPDRRHRLERPALFRPLAKVQQLDAAACRLLRAPLVHDHQAIGVTKWQRTEQALRRPERTSRCWLRCPSASVMCRDQREARRRPQLANRDSSHRS